MAPLSAAEPVAAAQAIAGAVVARAPGAREELPRVRNSKTFKFAVAGTKGYFIMGEYEDGRPGELFISISKQGSTLRGIMDSFAVSISFCLQYGVPLKKLVKSFTNISFAPAGITDDPDIRTASSLIDYVFRRLGKTYLSFDDQLEVGLAHIDEIPQGQTSLLTTGNDDAVPETTPQQAMETLAEAEAAITEAITTIAASTADMPNVSDETQLASESEAGQKKTPVQDSAAPLCYNCGNQTMRAGSCYVCTACGSTTGCS